jgi:hypothetical protein
MKTGTSENLDLSLALTIYSRTRFIVNLLPLLQAAPALRRVVTVFAGTKEGPIFPNDFGCDKVSLFNIHSIRGHMCSMIDFSLEAIAKDAPSVSFIHDYPGFVDTGIFEKTSGALAAAIRGVSKVSDALFRSRRERYIPIEQSGERHLFLATSARYGPADGEVLGTPLGSEVSPARDSCGKVGGGVYIVDENLESASPEVERLLGQMRKEGMREKVWKHTEGEFNRITGLMRDMEGLIDS